MVAVLEISPDSRPITSWQARLASLIGRGCREDDPAIRECRQAMAYHRVRKVLDAQAGQLDRAGADLLCAAVRAAVAQ
jgi:hypothetical protein